MQIPEQSCDHLEQALAALERRQARLQEILDTEPDLGASQRLRLRRQLWEIENEIIATRTQLQLCQADFTVVGIELTQGTQYFSITGQGSGFGPDNSIPLIARRPLTLRVYVHSNRAVHTLPVYVTGRLTVDRVRIDGSVRRVASLRPINGFIGARAADSIDRRDISHTLNFRLNAEDCRGLLRFTVQAFEQDPISQQAFGQNPAVLSQRPLLAGEPASVEAAPMASSPFGGTLHFTTTVSVPSPPVGGTLRFTTTAPLLIRLVRIAYRNAARGYDLPAPTVADFWSAAEFVLRTFPVPNIEVQRESVKLYDGDFTSFFASGGPAAQGTTGTIFEILDRLRSEEELADDVRYVALIPGRPANLSAMGHSIRRRQISEVDGPTLAQELAHDSGFPGHADCGNPNDPDLSYPQYSTTVEASIGEVGFDVVASNTYDPALYHDVMSYCRYDAPGKWSKWISPYTYEKLVTHYKAATAASRVLPIPQQIRTRDAIVVSFAVIDGQVANVQVSPGVMVASLDGRSPLPFTVQTYDDAGAVVDSAAVHLEDPYQSVTDREIHLSVALPLRDESRSISILKDMERVWSTQLPQPSKPRLTISVSKSTEAQEFIVDFKGPRQQNVRLDYSHDDGTSWQTVADNVSSGRHVVDTSMLPGGDRCRMRAVLSDGCRRYCCISEEFQVQGKPVSVEIASPRTGLVVQQADTVQLLAARTGSGQTDSLADMNWSSSIDGFLGAGGNLLVHMLSLGRHRITLSADDGVGGESSSHVFIRVVDDDEETAERAAQPQEPPSRSSGVGPI